MFGYFRIFSIISLVVFIALTTATGFMFHNKASKDINKLIGTNSQSIVESYIEAVWKKHPEAVAIFKNRLLM